MCKNCLKKEEEEVGGDGGFESEVNKMEIGAAACLL